MIKTTAKALTNIILPDGSKVKEGEEFLYNGDFENTGLFEIVGAQNDGQIEGAPQDVRNEEEEVRAKAKELKISNWHTKAIKKLKEEIAEKENELAAKGQNDGQIEGAPQA